jgi:ribosomal protein S18 acetylase RimI-like enzyme
MHPLDNAIWNALATRQAEFAECFDQACRFMPQVTSLGAFLEPSARGYESLAGLLDSGRTIMLALEAPHQPRPGWNLVVSAPGLQMIWQDSGHATLRPPEVRPSPRESAPEIVELDAADLPAMMELTALTKPGPFNHRTHELGTYLGIRCDGKLVAMAGERLKVSGHTEVSAVCTHPEHTGHGYARILMTELMQRIRSRGETPFLHVRQDNARAIELYQRLGFTQRLALHMTVLRKE